MDEGGAGYIEATGSGEVSRLKVTADLNIVGSADGLGKTLFEPDKGVDGISHWETPKVGKGVSSEGKAQKGVAQKKHNANPRWLPHTGIPLTHRVRNKDPTENQNFPPVGSL